MYRVGPYPAICGMGMLLHLKQTRSCGGVRGRIVIHHEPQEEKTNRCTLAELQLRVWLCVPTLRWGELRDGTDQLLSVHPMPNKMYRIGPHRAG